MKDKLFISYRRSADAWAVGHLRERLLGEFGREQVFFDTDTLQAGEGWLGAIREAIAGSSAVVVVFCAEWYGPLPDGSRRIDRADDPVRLELLQAHAASQAGVAIVPVVVDQARAPGPADLPEDLRFLCALHFRRLNPTDSVDRQVNRLIGDIRHAIHGTRPWTRIALQSLWMGLLAGALAGGLQRAGLAAPFQDAFAATVQTLRAARPGGTPDELALVEINDGEYRELFGGRLPLDPGVLAIAVMALARQSAAANACRGDRPVGINLDLSPGEAFANRPGTAALEAALAALARCRPLVLACPQSVERRSASANDLAWLHRLGTPASGAVADRGVMFASTLIDSAVLHYSAGGGELGVWVGDLAAGRADAGDTTGRRCACPVDEETMRGCDQPGGSAVSAVAAALAWNRRSMVVPFATAPLRFSLAEALLAGTRVMGQPVVMIGGAFGTQGRYPISGLPEAAQRGVTGTTVHGFLANSVLHHAPARWPAAAALAAGCAAAALTCLGLTLCWWMVARNPHRFSRRAGWYLVALAVALGLPLTCLALAVTAPAWAWLAGGLALACGLANARSAVAGTELLVHGGVAWKSPRGLWQALANEADRASALMRLALLLIEALLIVAGTAAVLLT